MDRFKRNISRVKNRSPFNRIVPNNIPQDSHIKKSDDINVHNQKVQTFDGKDLGNVYFRYLLDKNSKGNDDQLPFFYNHPPIQGIFDLRILAKEKNQELLRCYENVRINKIAEKYDIVTIIPFRGRWLHLEKTIESLIESSSYANCKIGFVIIENSNEPIFKIDNISSKNNIHYRWINSGGKIFNKCFCHNIGAGITDSEFIHFHDCDLLVPYNFYESLINELRKNPAVQAFSGRKVNYIKEEPSINYFNGDDISDIIKNSDNYKEGTFGAPGGSIALSRDLFLNVGGFDPHFFWAYSIEDKFFWEKVEKYNKITTLDDPKIDLYHLWHPPGWGKNPYERFEQRIYQIFSQDRHSWQNYINTAIELYNTITEKFIEQ